MELKFLADSMLGRLAKWLRVLGHDTQYLSRAGMITPLVSEGRRLLSRHRRTVDLHQNSILILSDHVREQLHEMKERGALPLDRSKWFSRCLICNVPLDEAKPERALEQVPEYVFYQNLKEIRSCPSCGRHFWPGSHRMRMMKQLEEWGFS